MQHIYHITTAANWKAAQEQGYYEAPSLQVEGFIHCSTEHQVAGVLQRYYQNQTGLLKLVIDPTKLTHELKYEVSPSINEQFPHVYGIINLDAVVDVEFI